ncbi:MAG TPA: hypothetical protein VE953_18340 [Terriglobales bacterium]|nr:hypothetical protein [Terriglobales bacterium]
MARGDPAFALENLVPYFRGGRFAMVAVRGRGYGVPELDRQVERYIAMTDNYMAAAVATFRLRRQRESEQAGGP